MGVRPSAGAIGDRGEGRRPWGRREHGEGAATGGRAVAGGSARKLGSWPATGSKEKERRKKNSGGPTGVK
jgi:hypothetical protein